MDGGLVVPVVRDADGKTLTQVAREARELIGRAREGTLAADDLGGGTFTVSNLGMFGVEQFTAVINPPEAAILAVGAALPEPVATDDGVLVHRRMRLTLSIDHRALAGATGAGFLQQLKTALEHPCRSSPDRSRRHRHLPLPGALEIEFMQSYAPSQYSIECPRVRVSDRIDRSRSNSTWRCVG